MGRARPMTFRSIHTRVPHTLRLPTNTYLPAYTKPEGYKNSQKEHDRDSTQLLTFPHHSRPNTTPSTRTRNASFHRRHVCWFLLLALVAGLPAREVDVGAGGADPVARTGLVPPATRVPSGGLRLAAHSGRIGRSLLAAVVALRPPGEVIILAIDALPVAWLEGGPLLGRLDQPWHQLLHGGSILGPHLAAQVALLPVGKVAVAAGGADPVARLGGLAAGAGEQGGRAAGCAGRGKAVGGGQAGGHAVRAAVGAAASVWGRPARVRWCAGVGSRLLLRRVERLMGRGVARADAVPKPTTARREESG